MVNEERAGSDQALPAENQSVDRIAVNVRKTAFNGAAFVWWFLLSGRTLATGESSARLNGVADRNMATAYAYRLTCSKCRKAMTLIIEPQHCCGDHDIAVKNLRGALPNATNPLRNIIDRQLS
jgi:hypothetical protein